MKEKNPTVFAFIEGTTVPWEGSTFPRSLMVDLTRDEQIERAERLAMVLEKKADEEADAKLTAARHKEKIAGHTTEIRELATVITNRAELRDVECCHVRDDARSQMHTVRQDTFEVIETRAMYETEKQVALFPVEGGKKKSKRGGHAPTTPEWQAATEDAAKGESA